MASCASSPQHPCVTHRGGVTCLTAAAVVDTRHETALVVWRVQTTNQEVVQVEGVTFTALDLGGHEAVRYMWENGLEAANAG